MSTRCSSSVPLEYPVSNRRSRAALRFPQDYLHFRQYRCERIDGRERGNKRQVLSGTQRARARCVSALAWA